MEENIISKWLFKYGNEIIRKKTEEKLERLMKQETIEEAMNQNGYHDPKKDKLWREGVQFGAKWQQERMYSEEEVKPLLEFVRDCTSNWDCDMDAHKNNTTCRMCAAKDVLKQFKK